MEKLYFTIDLDSFYISCEQLLNPKIADVPAVVGSELNGKGVISTSNYKARELGIYGAMPIFKAKKIYPNLLVIKPKPNFYIEMNTKVFSIVKDYSEKMEVVSIDECYVDVTNLSNKYKPIELAKKIKKDILDKTGLNVSIGISTNILLSKMASSMDKPNGITTLWKHELKDKLWNKPIKYLFMVGERTSEYFISQGIKTIGDLVVIGNNPAKYNIVKRKIGIALDKYIATANGDLNKEINLKENQLKSISKAKTLPIVLYSYQEVYNEMNELAKIAFNKLIRRKLSTRSIRVSIRQVKGPMKIKTINKNLNGQTNDWDDIWGNIKLLFDEIYNKEKPTHQIGVSFAELRNSNKTYKQLTIDESDSKVNKMQDLIDDISLITNSELFFGSAMNNNRIYEKKEDINKDNVKFKHWGD